MTKPTIVTRAGKGSALTWTEGDSNLTNLQNATIAIKADTGGTDVVSDLNGTVTLVAGSNVTITGDNTAKTVTIAAAGGSLALDDLTDVSAASPMSGDTLVWNNASSVWQAQAPSGGSMNLDDLTDVNTTMVTDGQVLTYNNSLVRWEGTTISSGISDVVSDTTPQLGGNLDVQANIITTSTTNGNISITPDGTGQTVIKNIEYNEYIHNLGTTGGTISPNVTNGNVQKITLNSALTINAFTSPVAGQSLTLIITGGTAYTSITSTMKFAGGIKTLTATAGCIDILTVFYDGTTYYASLGKGYA